MNFFRNFRARQVAMVQPFADNAQPNDRAMTYFVARVLGVTVAPIPTE